MSLEAPPATLPNFMFRPFWSCHSGSLGEWLRRNASDSRTWRRRATSVLHRRRRSADFDDVGEKRAGNHPGRRFLCGTDTDTDTGEAAASRRAAGRESEHRRGGRLGPGELPVQRHAAGQRHLPGTCPASSRR